MRNNELWQSYDYYTSDLTKHSRQLGFAGVAICWLFRTPEGEFGANVVLALIFLVGFFILDVAQYYTGAMLHRFWIQRQEAKMHNALGSIEGNYDKPRWLDRPAFILFHAKVLALVAGFGSLGVELTRRF